MSTALLTSYAKDESLLRIARILAKNGWNILGSTGTTGYLKENGVSCKDVADTIGPPILGHRVVTLSREVYAGLLATTEADFAELKILNINFVRTTSSPITTPFAPVWDNQHSSLFEV